MGREGLANVHVRGSRQQEDCQLGVALGHLLLEKDGSQSTFFKVDVTQSRYGCQGILGVGVSKRRVSGTCKSVQHVCVGLRQHLMCFSLC